MTTTNKEFEVKHGLVVAATTSATSTTTGSAVIKGGAGIAENLYVGGNLFVTGTVSSTSTNATSVTVNNDTSTAATHYLTFVNASSGEAAIKVDNSDLFYQPSTGSLGVGNSNFTEKFAVTGTASVSSNFSVGGNATVTGDLAVNGGDITSTSATFVIGNTATTTQTLDLATAATASGQTKTVNIATGGAAGSTTTINIGSSGGGTTTISSPSVVISGDLTVNGTTTTVNSSTLAVDDKNIELGSVAAVTVSTTGTVGSISGTGPWTATITGMTSTAGLIVGSAISATNGTGSLGAAGSYIVASIVSATSITFTATGGTTPTAGTVTNITTTGATDVTANGGGITLKGATDKTLNWIQSTGRWTSNQPFEATSIQNTPIGSTAPTTGRFTTVESTIATGTAPLTVASTTLVTNLNADLLDGNHASAFYAFGTLSLDNTDTEYTWSTTEGATVVAETLADTLKVVKGSGIEIAFDATNDAIRIAHSDTSSVANLTAVANTFVTGLTFDTFGHVTGHTTAAATKYTLDGNSPAANSVDLQLIGTDSTTDSINIVGTGSTTVSWDEGNQRLTINSKNTAWVRKTSAYTAVATDKIVADTSGGAFTITLPATPAIGDSVMIADGDNWYTNNLTVARNGSTIEGQAQDIILNIPGIQTEFIYDGTTWEVYAFTGPSGVDVTDDTTTATTVYPLWASAATGFLPTKVSSSKMYFVPSTGTLSTVDYNSLSDRNLKENIAPITNALDIVDQLNPVTFDWKDTGKHAYGVIAQEIEEVIPELVQTHPETDIKSVSYMQLVPILLKAIQELKQEIKDLKDKM